MNQKTFNEYSQQIQQTQLNALYVSQPVQSQQQPQQAYLPQHSGSLMSMQQHIYFLPGGSMLYTMSPQCTFMPLAYNAISPTVQQSIMLPQSHGLGYQPVPQPSLISTATKKLQFRDPVTNDVVDLRSSQGSMADSHSSRANISTNDVVDLRSPQGSMADSHSSRANISKSIALAVAEHLKKLSTTDKDVAEVAEHKVNNKPTRYVYDRDELLYYGKIVAESPNNFPVSVENEQQDDEDVKKATVDKADKKDDKKKTNAYRPSGQYRLTPQQYQQQRESNAFQKPILRSETPMIKRAAPNDGRGETPTATNEPPPVQLRKATKAWKPLRKAMQGLDPELAKLEKQKTEIRGIMNKITPTTFEQLSQELCEMHVHKDDKLLPHVVDIIFEKAVDEPKYCELYSKLCSKLNRFEDSEAVVQNDPGAFRRAVIQKCQKHFEARAEKDKSKPDDASVAVTAQKSSTNVVATAQKFSINVAGQPSTEESSAVGATSTQSVEQSAPTKEELELQKSKSKRYFLGTIRFISHIYCTGFIGPQVLHHCVISLVMRYESDKDEEYIEFLVRLYETIGRTYEEQLCANRAALERDKLKLVWRKNVAKDEPQAPPPSQSYDPFTNIEDIFNYLWKNATRFSTRTKVLVINMVDMRKSGWKPRNVDKLTPKTMEELQAEAEEEKLREEQAREDYQLRQYNGGPMHHRVMNTGGGGNFTPPVGRHHAPLPLPPRGGQSRIVDNRKIADNRRSAAANASVQAAPSSYSKPTMSLAMAIKEKGLKKPSFFLQNSQDQAKDKPVARGSSKEKEAN